MKELYCVYVDLYFERERERRLSEREEGITMICCRFYLFSLLDYIKGRTGCFSMDVAQIG